MRDDSSYLGELQRRHITGHLGQSRVISPCELLRRRPLASARVRLDLLERRPPATQLSSRPTTAY